MSKKRPKGGKNGDGEEEDSLFKWVPRDHFGSREAGEEAARESAEKTGYGEAFKAKVAEIVARQIAQGGRQSVAVTSQMATDELGLPQDYGDGSHPSGVGGNMRPAARALGLVKIGQTYARGRHQNGLTIWGYAPEGVEVDLKL